MHCNSICLVLKFVTIQFPYLRSLLQKLANRPEVDVSVLLIMLLLACKVSKRLSHVRFFFIMLMHLFGSRFCLWLKHGKNAYFNRLSRVSQYEKTLKSLYACNWCNVFSIFSIGCSSNGRVQWVTENDLQVR